MKLSYFSCFCALALVLLISCTRKQVHHVAPGITVVKLWEVTESKQMTAVIHLTESNHHEFHSDPTAFINKYKIFPEPVSRATCQAVIGNKIVPLSDIPPTAGGITPIPGWVVTYDLGHL